MANSPTSLPIRRTNDLSIGRRSTPGAAYFITLCESHRRASLIREPIADEIKRSLDALHASGDIELIAAVVMLDHIHLLGVLGHRLSLGRLMGRFKARTHNVLRPLGFEWQENFYEHHLRADDDSRTLRPLHLPASLSGKPVPSHGAMAALVALG